MSARKVFLKAMKDAALAVRARRYFVKRGVINWASHDFKTKLFAISLQADDYSFMKQNGIQDMKFSMEIATSINDIVSPAQLNDDVIEELVDDAEWIFKTVMSQIDTLGDNVALVVDTESARVIEFHDSSLRVQGIVVTAYVKY